MNNPITIQKHKNITLATGKKLHVIKIEDIVRCEAFNTYTLFYLSNGAQILMTKTLKEYES